MNTFTTKAKTLQSLRPVLTSAKVLPIVICTVGQLRQDPQALLNTLEREGLLVNANIKVSHLTGIRS